MRRWIVPTVGVFAVIAALAALDRQLGPSRARSSVLPKAEWIWASGSERRQVGPQAFLAVGDFEVASAPATAWLLIQVDEEYLVSLNGRLLGSGRYPGFAVLDRYPVQDLLRVGSNRIVVEARTGRGAGGLIAAVTDGEGHVAVRSDRSWRIFRRYRPGVVRGTVLIEEGEAVWSWERPPIGRWGTVEEIRDRPRLDQMTRRETSPRGKPVGEVGRPGRQRRRSEAEGVITLDWGRTVEGILSFHLSGKERTLGLLFAGERPPRPEQDEPVGVVVTVPGSPFWQDSCSRRFRYATVVGIRERMRARVFELPAPVAELLSWRPRERIGVFGLNPPPLGSPVEDKVWRSLESVPSEETVQRP